MCKEERMSVVSEDMSAKQGGVVRIASSVVQIESVNVRNFQKARGKCFV